MKKIGLLNGPNLDRLGKREPEIYGCLTLSEIEEKIKEKASLCQCKVDCFQSNHEGQLIDKITELAEADIYGLIINPGGLTHTSVALRDAIAGSNIPTIEVHITNIYNREEFRKKSLISKAAKGIICGFGVKGYIMALDSMKEILN